MRAIRTPLFVFALSLFVIAPARAQQARTIYLVRHADKLSDDADAPLNDAGRVRAACLANTLHDANIQQIFTSELQRTQQTAAPLASELHLKSVAVPISKVDELIDAVRGSKAENVLVVWHDATLPKIIQALGGPEIPPIGHTEYDHFFILLFSAVASTSKPGFVALRYCDPQK